MTERSSEAFAIQTTQPVITNNLALETRFEFPAFLGDHHVVALVNVPILLPGRRPWGVLQVDARTPQTFGREDIEFLKTYAMVLGPVIDRLQIAVEREEARSGLADREERLRRVLDGMGEGFTLLASDFTILEHNREAQRMDGRPRGEVTGLSHWEVYPGSEQNEVGRQLRKAMTERIPVSLEHRFAREDGQTRWLEMRAFPTADGALAVFWRDITDRKAAVDALRGSEARYRALFESMDEAYAVVEVLKDSAGRWTDFRFIEVNPAFIAHTAMPWPVDKTATELLGKPNLRWTSLYGQALESGQPIRVEEDEPTLGRTFDLNIFALDREHNRVAVLFTNITERRQAEAALRESEARFQQFAGASAGALWIRDANTLEMEYVSPAVASIYGIDVDALMGDIKFWAAMVLPEDRAAALADIDRTRLGDTVAHEFRIQRSSDQAFRWVRNIGFPLRDSQGRVERVGGIFEDITEAKLAVEHQGVLLAELQHRVRNIMAIIRSITNRTGERAESVSDYAERMSGRLMALARVQALITQKAGGGVRLTTLIHDELVVQADHDGQYDLDGPEVLLSPKAAEVLTLAVHELTTNALKYGALAVDTGKIAVSWEVDDREGQPWLTFDWSEDGAPSRPAAGQPVRRGFGTELIEGRIPYELGGAGRVVVTPGGARCHLEFPLQAGASALETSAPLRATVYGGALDMTGEARLDGATVLVVEDEYYIATDTARALQGAGAEVVGPFRTEDAARSAIDEHRPDVAVVDINLGTGLSFKLAETLKDRGIPFVFVTGYDQQVILDEFKDIDRLEKPVQLRQVVRAVSKLLTPDR